MWSQKGRTRKKAETTGIVAVAIDKDKGSQHALKWAADNLVSKGQTIVLIHVINKTQDAEKEHIEKQTKDLFMTFHCYCSRKDIRCLDVTLEDKEIFRALTEYAASAAIENLVLGAPSRNGFIRKFKISDVPSNVSKAAPDFCTVYVISKGKISSLRSALRTAPFSSPLLSQIENQSAVTSYEKFRNSMSFKDSASFKPSPSSLAVEDPFRSLFAKAKNNGSSFYDFSDSETEISFVSSGRPSSSTTTSSPSFMYDFPEYSGLTPRLSTSSAQSIGSTRSGIKSSDSSLQQDFSFVSQDSGRTSCSYSSQSLEEAETEMKRLKLELKHTMDLYGTACREALAAKQEAQALQRRQSEEEQRSRQGPHSEAQRRVKAENNGFGKSEKVTASVSDTGLSYRRYTFEEIEEASNHFSESNKIGEGGYGPVFKCHLDHTAVAVKVLRPDAEQGRSQFQKEVEVLSCIRHPNMVLLLGACPEYGVLVYEYMAKGSLADRLCRRGNTAPLSWPLRFRIAAEIATALLFLHQTKPEPLVHRDLKPGNILLDQNYVSKISDVGLARLVPAVAENVTQCHVTSTAGTFCYIDPEYQQTGMLGVKSDVYSFGILLLELLTNRQPMGLAYHVEQAIEEGTFKEMLDPSVQDWPVEEALSLAKLALKCTELRRKDRPDLGKVVLPHLNRLRALADENMENVMSSYSVGISPNPSQVNLPVVDVVSMNSECSKTQSSSSSDTEKHSPGAQK